MGAEWLTYLSSALASAVVSVLIYRAVLASRIKQQLVNADIERKRILSEADIESKRARDEANLEIDKRLHQARLKEEENVRNEQQLSGDREKLNNFRADLEQKLAHLSTRESELQQVKREYLDKLQSLSSTSEQEIKSELIAQVKESCEHELKVLSQNLRDQTENEIENKARDILITAMQRISTNPAVDATATIVDLPSEDMKGRIIGREGRNIRSFEAVTGTTLMIDETPDSVLISAFDPVKREIARTALESLLKDGRIHPSTIEAAYDKAKTDVLKNVQLLGEEAMTRLKLKPAHSEILKLLGQLHFRLSLNQNSLEHSIEVAYIASMLASELGLDPVIAKRGALLHDIGKAMDHEFEGSHALIAGKMLRRYDEDPRVVNAVEASHEEVPPESVYAPLIAIADRISAMRPGARCDSLDSYVDRVKTLEDLARGFEGVKDAFALQAGREIRVIVEPSKLSDDEAQSLARTISREIEDTMNYPSTIKITVIRELRFCETAK